MKDTILSGEEVKGKLGISRATFFRKLAKRQVPFIRTFLDEEPTGITYFSELRLAGDDWSVAEGYGAMERERMALQESEERELVIRYVKALQLLLVLQQYAFTRIEGHYSEEELKTMDKFVRDVERNLKGRDIDVVKGNTEEEVATTFKEIKKLQHDRLMDFFGKETCARNSDVFFDLFKKEEAEWRNSLPVRRDFSGTEKKSQDEKTAEAKAEAVKLRKTTEERRIRREHFREHVQGKKE